MLTYDLIVPNKHQIEILFDLLNKRKHSVSHVDMPSWSEHDEFVKTNPYRAWYLIKDNENYIGTVYLTNENHISISFPYSNYSGVDEVLSWVIQNHKPLKGIKSVRPDCYQINIPASDVGFMALLDNMGYDQAQVTYLIRDA